MNNVKALQTIEETLKYLQFDNWEQSAPGLARSRELLGLLGDGFRHTRMAMPQAVNPDTREQIEVFLTLFVLYGNALTFNEADGLALEGVHDIRIV